MKKLTVYIMLTTMLFLSGCGTESDEACAHQVSIDLDSENFSSVISTLENNGTCNGEFLNEEAWLNLGAAYIGSAGISVGSLVSTITNVDPAEGMGGLLAAFDSVSTTAGLNHLTDAQETYGYITSGVDCNLTTGLTVYQEAACLYGGFANTLKGVGVLNAVLGDAITFLTTPVTLGDTNDVNDNGTSDEIEVTACAIADASVTGTATACTTAPTIAFTSSGGVTFTTTGFSDVYIPNTYTVTDSSGDSGGDTTYYRMIDQGAVPPSPVTTVDTCDSSFANVGCTINMTTCFPCPVVIDGESPTVTSGLLDLVNSGALEGADDNGSITAVMDGDSDGTVTEAELAAFLQTL